MDEPFREQDWKYLRSIHDEMFHGLCERINKAAVEILTAEDRDPPERYQELFRHIHDSDKVIAFCFDDWRRSRTRRMVHALRGEGLLTDEHISHLTDEAQTWIRSCEGGW